MARALAMVTLLAAALLPAARAQPVAPAPIAPRWTISSADCVGVHADGEPWRQCGFQSWDMNADGSRILTVSTGGTVQLWDGADGREIRRIDWPDGPGGASGHPSAQAMFVGGVALAYIHHNQLLILDPADGRERVRGALPVMTIHAMKRLGDRVFVDYRNRNWDSGAGEIDLRSGTLGPVRGLANLDRMGPNHWVEGTRPPFIIHMPGRAPSQIRSERSCMPFDANVCVWRDIPGRALHIFEVGVGRWRTFDLGQVHDGYTAVDFVLAGNRPYALICGRARDSGGQRPCTLRDLADGRDVHHFIALHARAVGAVDGEGRPEVRIAMGTEIAGRGETIRIAADGTVRRVAQSLQMSLRTPGNGMLLPDWSPETSLLVDAAGRTVARLAFAPNSCGVAWVSGFSCPATTDGRRWLVPAIRRLREGTDDNRTDLALYELPVPAP